jgi:hypothetical protein
MSKTATLRKVVTEQLKATPGGTYHRLAPKDASFPYKTYTLKSVSFTDARDDFDLCVDVWDRSDDPKTAEEVADQVEKLFRSTNIPQDTILPTFFRENRYTLEDPDKTLQHIQLHFHVQLYELEE